MEKKERKSLGKANFLDGRSLKKMFDEKPGDSSILVGVMTKQYICCGPIISDSIISYLNEFSEE